MLVAMSNERLIIASDANRTNDKYYCPGCRQTVLLRHGKHRVPHFAHKKHTLCGFSEGETLEHLRGKKQIYQWMKIKNWHPQLEVYLPQINQRPDILLNNEKQKIAIEFQCSPLSLERMIERNKGYKRVGITVWWILGAPYFSRLGNKKIVQFTQILNGRPALLFWDTKKDHLIIKYDYWRCSYSSLKFDQELIMNKQIKMLIEQQHCHSSNELRELAITTFKLTGRILAQCPLVCHDLVASWPAMSQPIILWRIGVILKLMDFPIFYSWRIDEWKSLLMSVGHHKWLQSGCISGDILKTWVIHQYTSELIHTEIIFCSNNHFILCQRPHWVNHPQAKLKIQHRKRSA
ncbi:competence protein CoiA [Limosilactobacillus sp. STM2_1]|uniref:Competence protein CoiA n=1 Tax=Limosilactobacillus rudii TaxID=2759755 RepID=A0A7W3UJH6_9LACO|nr:competence protein CoiA family protein [Limosilactobacillus rudii]MBB1078522.1 competence protein CoiA [Limosilactobacillus rudii]MBB1096651.1 competence protein CoiA [Limosilactobacillus rudii]MCD7133684.1 competence protein CoiA [Limosilactobacillus rudii]